MRCPVCTVHSTVTYSFTFLSTRRQQYILFSSQTIVSLVFSTRSVLTPSLLTTRPHLTSFNMSAHTFLPTRCLLIPSYKKFSFIPLILNEVCSVLTASYVCSYNKSAHTFLIQEVCSHLYSYKKSADNFITTRSLLKPIFLQDVC